ncbi:SpoIIE family protein phosphatase [Longimicrobium sp.]|uniref:SpoIIE family protein phosphatase n=1 Tax=Longimicrobium sp. TaxID=2029185 RepID=UPI002CAEC086|nr:SpoIIE family protein phosphatase [Longimicrobium sp.]HSU13240.1 SpoIIE family protein phosphatase [Longimicrobium sp.]
MEVAGEAVPVAPGDASAAGEVRRRVARLAAVLELDETAAGRAAIIATEAATNLAKHARAGGTVFVRGCNRGEVLGIELLAVDSGPGMADPTACIRDGFSTAGSPGTGMGALRRQSDEFELFTLAGSGTVVLSRVWATPPPDEAVPGLSVAALSIPKPGQEVCGDAWASASTPGRTVVIVADGLGHGPDAAAAAREAVRVFRAHAAERPAALLERMHRSMRSTRGAAVAVAEVGTASGRVRFCGVGNISAAVLTPGRDQSMVSHNGIVGHEMRKVHEFEYAWSRASLLVMHSDGVGTRWDLGRYPGLQTRDPAVVAAVLYRDFTRGNDDATVAAAREPPA